MAEATRINGDLVVLGEILGATGIAYPAGSIVNANISGSAAIAATKLQKAPSVHYQQAGTAVDATVIVHIVKGATATLKHFTCSNVATCSGAATITLDLKKNGVSVLSAVVTLDNATGDLGEATGTLTTTALVDGDVLTVVVDATTVYGTDVAATGVFAQVDLIEDYAS